MSKLIVTLFSFFLLSINVLAQKECDIENSVNYKDLKVVNAEKVKCLAKQNERQSLFWSFGIWCAPCKLHSDNAFKFAKEHNLNFYVILIEDDKSNNSQIERAVNYLKAKDEDVKILLLSNEYSSRPRVKYKKFVTEITPSQFENIPGMSKYILVNNEGVVQMVTNYKDYAGDDWRDDSGLQKRRLLPLINPDML